MASDSRSTHFGFRTVSADQKAGLVGEVFGSVAGKYDVMNDLMSFGAHRLWKQFAVNQSGVRAGHQVLDVAGGSGDLAIKFARLVGSKGGVTLTDINEAMLMQGRERLIDHGVIGNVTFAQCDAEKLPFDANQFDCVSIAFGLRNVTHIDAALASMFAVVRPGGRLLVLEFSHPHNELFAQAYDAYSFNVIPKIGKWVAGDEASYQYLVESIRKHPDQETLKEMMQEAGFERVRYFNLAGGIVALHVGFKF
ncbi:MAG: bifunctional demethylmenaquinone methyltransferase/2-methoxy-6-polyprenyl-1,4-benzoquinol methylase UbiE [Gammaproteobacteria bacterium]|nr:bifunctional demethylmenaquinone methyltransferase/2-methoxy-6-polyprenyl-1,4-benzoquinol methylase UbiE [Gammaproteobacteria bacterium]